MQRRNMRPLSAVAEEIRHSLLNKLYMSVGTVRVSFQHARISFQHTRISFQNMHVSFQHTHVSFQNVGVSFRHTGISFHPTRGSPKNMGVFDGNSNQCILNYRIN